MTALTESCSLPSVSSLYPTTPSRRRAWKRSNVSSSQACPHRSVFLFLFLYVSRQIGSPQKKIGKDWCGKRYSKCKSCLKIKNTFTPVTSITGPFFSALVSRLLLKVLHPHSHHHPSHCLPAPQLPFRCPF